MKRPEYDNQDPNDSPFHVRFSLKNGRVSDATANRSIEDFIVIIEYCIDSINHIDNAEQYEFSRRIKQESKPMYHLVEVCYFSPDDSNEQPEKWICNSICDDEAKARCLVDLKNIGADDYACFRYRASSVLPDGWVKLTPEEIAKREVI